MCLLARVLIAILLEGNLERVLPEETLADTGVEEVREDIQAWPQGIIPPHDRPLLLVHWGRVCGDPHPYQCYQARSKCLH